MNYLFHKLADRGKEITSRKREFLLMGVHLSSSRVEWLINLEEIKKEFYEQFKSAKGNRPANG